jgi:predicted ATPase
LRTRGAERSSRRCGALTGRAEMSAALAALRVDGTRLLTFTGSGGSGKTRLALQAAASAATGFEHGAYFVELAPLADAGQVPSAILSALQVAEFNGKRPAMEALKDFLRDRQLLLVLDNLEHLLAVAAEVGELLQACRRLRIVATSREPLHLRMEHELRVLPFDTEGLCGELPLADLEKREAVRLFVDRARMVRPDFQLTEATGTAVAEICARLDGLPLAIELAAGLMKFLPPAALLSHLRERVELPGMGGVDLPARQRTLEAAFRWSYELLEEGTRALVRQLSVFTGGWTLDGVRAVCQSTDGGTEVSRRLFRLVDKSLVQRDGKDGEPRFRMLQTVRTCARELLETSGDADETERRFASWCVDFAERAEGKLRGPEQETWLRLLDTEYSNLASTLERLRSGEGRLEGMRLAAALGWYWFRRSRFAEGDRWLSEYRLRGRKTPLSCAPGWRTTRDGSDRRDSS